MLIIIFYFTIVGFILLSIFILTFLIDNSVQTQFLLSYKQICACSELGVY